MEEQKFCPLTAKMGAQSGFGALQQVAVQALPCLKGKCAWWCGDDCALSIWARSQRSILTSLKGNPNAT